MTDLSPALQLYSLRREFEADPAAALATVPGLGYRQVEMAGTYGWSLEEWTRRLAGAGLTAISAHVPFELFERDFAGTLEFYRALGVRRLVYPYVAHEKQNADGYRHVARIVNEAARLAAGADTQVFYHNHAFEFTDVGGENGYDILLRETDPALVKFQVDTHWVEQSGCEAAAFIAQHAPRIGMVHAKEFRRVDKQDVPAGQGDVDFPAILRLAREQGWPVIVEFEGTDAPAAVRESARHLRSL